MIRYTVSRYRMSVRYTVTLTMSRSELPASSSSIAMLLIAFSVWTATSPMPTDSRVSRSWPI